MPNKVTGSKPKDKTQAEKEALNPQLGSIEEKQEKAYEAEQQDKVGGEQTITPKPTGVKP